MGVLDGVLGRPAAREPDLSRLFALPAVAIGLAAETGFVPAGMGAVCHRLVEGGPFGAFSSAQREVVRLLGQGTRDGPGAGTGVSAGPYGWGWVRVTRPPDELERLVGDLHMVNSTLEASGYGSFLLCSAVHFRRGEQRLCLVHLHGRGTFYPFAPHRPDPGGQVGRRNNVVEMRVRDAVAGELPIEEDTGRWYPVWDVPGL